MTQGRDSGSSEEFDLKGIIRTVIIVVIIASVIAFVGGIKSTFFTINPEEQGIVLRFGKVHRTVDPGLHFKWPLSIERVERVSVQRQLKEEFGFRTMRADVRSQYTKSGFEGESLMLTGDLNSADVEWVVQYRISDPIKYLFHVRNVQDTFRDINEATMREIIGDRSVDEVITWGKEEINLEAQVKLQEICDQYGTGMTIQAVLLQNVNAPPPVQPSWNEVNAAEQEKDKLINQAKAQYNSIIPKAKGEAERKVKESEGYAIERINRAIGESEKFNQVYLEYVKVPKITRQRIYLETMAEIIPKAGKKVIVDKNEQGLIRFLDLGKEGGVK